MKINLHNIRSKAIDKALKKQLIVTAWRNWQPHRMSLSPMVGYPVDVEEVFSGTVGILENGQPDCHCLHHDFRV